MRMWDIYWITAARMIVELRQLPCENRLQSFGLMSMVTRRLRGHVAGL